MRRPVDKEIGRDQPAERLSNARRVGHERKELGEEERAVVLPALAVPEADTHSCLAPVTVPVVSCTWRAGGSHPA